MVCEPTASADVENAAMPPGSRVAVPRVVLPSRKVTVPVGVPVVPVTVAVKVTESPKVDGFFDDDTAVFDVNALSARRTTSLPSPPA